MGIGDDKHERFLKEQATNIRKGRSLLRIVEGELDTIPKYKKMKSLREPGAEAMNLSGTASNVITALRRGIRSLGGGESAESLVRKRKKLTLFLDEAERYLSAPKAGPGNLMPVRDERDAIRPPKLK